MVVSLNYCSQNGGNLYRAPYYNGNPNIGPRIIGNLDQYPYRFRREARNLGKPFALKARQPSKALKGSRKVLEGPGGRGDFGGPPSKLKGLRVRKSCEGPGRPLWSFPDPSQDWGPSNHQASRCPVHFLEFRFFRI